MCIYNPYFSKIYQYRSKHNGPKRVIKQHFSVFATTYNISGVSTSLRFLQQTSSCPLWGQPKSSPCSWHAESTISSFIKLDTPGSSRFFVSYSSCYEDMFFNSYTLMLQLWYSSFPSFYREAGLVCCFG